MAIQGGSWFKYFVAVLFANLSWRKSRGCHIEGYQSSSSCLAGRYDLCDLNEKWGEGWSQGWWWRLWIDWSSVFPMTFYLYYFVRVSAIHELPVARANNENIGLYRESNGAVTLRYLSLKTRLKIAQDLPFNCSTVNSMIVPRIRRR